MPPVYFDFAATTPVAPRVLDVMLPYLGGGFGNPSSLHASGRAARHAVDEARLHIGASIDADPAGIVFTSGGTEANNMAIRALCHARPGKLVTSSTEHEAVLGAARAVSENEVVLLSPGPAGAVQPIQVQGCLDSAVAGVSLMLVNNETGARTQLREIASMCHEKGVLVHSDAVQSPAVDMVSVADLGVDFLTLSAHKIHGPKGVGLLWVRPGVDVPAMHHGGSQEQGRRGGTENVAGIVGFAEAIRMARAESSAFATTAAKLKARLLSGLRSRLGELFVVTSTADGAPHIVGLAFPPADGLAFDGEMLLLGLDLEGIQVSAGSACTSGTMVPSHVLLAMGMNGDTASASLRFSFGRSTTASDVDRAIEAMVRVVRRQLVIA